MPRIGNERWSERREPDPGENNNRASKFSIRSGQRPGWVTDVAVFAGGFNEAIDARLCLWDETEGEGDGLLLYASAPQHWSDETVWRSASPAPGAVRIRVNRGIWIGYWAQPDIVDQFGILEERRQGSNAPRRAKFSETAPAPNFRNAEARGGELAAYLDYKANENPGTGAFNSPVPSAAGEVFSTSPTFQGTMPHPGDAIYDYTDVVELRIWRTDTNQNLYSTTFQPTDAERAAGVWSRQPITVGPNIPIRARFRHRDSWGVWSGYSETLEFVTRPGPLPPTITSPIGRLNQLSGYNYAGVYNHTLAISSNAIQIQVLNATGTQILYDTGTVAKVVAPGAAWTHAEFHADLAWGTSYQWRVRFRSRNVENTADEWGGWSTADFRTNATPNQPTAMTPAGNRASGETVLSASVSDPDGDAIANVQIVLFDITANAFVTGYGGSGATITTISGGRMSHDLTGTLVFDHQYRWQARASDGIVYGPYSDWQTFTYLAVPNALWVAPRLATNLNIVNVPSPDLGAVSTYWTEESRTASDYVELTQDSDSAYGTTSWRGIASATSVNAYLSDFESVETASPYFFSVWAKKESGIAKARFEVLCYNASNTLLGTLNPSSMAVLSDTDVATTWNRYGGIVWPVGHASTPKFPTGTTKVRMRFTPSRNSLATVRFDAFFADRVPLVTPALWPEVQKYYGYFDGDNERFGTVPEMLDFAWLGDPGNSESIGPHVAEQTTLSAFITYSHPTGRAKQSDRLYIDRVVGSTFERVYTSPVEGAARTQIPIPGDVLRNNNSYRLTLEVTDTAGQMVTLPPTYFVYSIRGPIELNILVAYADIERAEVQLAFDRTALPLTKFAGIEIAKGPADDREVVELILDPLTDTWVDPFPVAGVETEYWVRQIENLDNGEQLESRWDKAAVQVDYEDWYLKDVEDPLNLSMRWIVWSDVPPSDEETPGLTSFRPWGKKKRTHIVQGPGPVTGSITARFLDETVDITETLRILREIRDKQGTLCLLSHRPPERRFVMLSGITRTSEHLPWYVTYELSWEETNYETSYYVREGVFVD